MALPNPSPNTMPGQCHKCGYYAFTGLAQPWQRCPRCGATNAR